MFVRSFEAKSIQADEKPFYQHVKLTRTEGTLNDAVQLDVEGCEKLIMSFPICESLTVTNGYVKIQKGFKGNLLKQALKKEELEKEDDDESSK